MNVRDLGRNLARRPGQARIYGYNHCIAPCRGQRRSMRGCRQILSRAHHRPPLPTGAMITAGEQATAGGGKPCVSREVKRIDAAAQFDGFILHLLFHGDFLATLDFDCLFHHRVLDGIPRGPHGGGIRSPQRPGFPGSGFSF